MTDDGDQIGERDFGGRKNFFSLLVGIKLGLLPPNPIMRSAQNDNRREK